MKIKTGLMTSLSSILLLPGISLAETTYVSTTDELQSALAAATAGDIIIASPGTYEATITSGQIATGDGGTVTRSWYFRAEAEGSSDAPITLKSEDPDDPAILSGAGWEESGYTLYVTGDYWVIEDIAVTEGAKGIMLSNSNYSEINNVEIYDIGQEGLHIIDGSSYNTIDGLNLHDVGKNDDGYGEGIYIGSDNSVWWEGDGEDTGESGLYYHRDVHDNLITNSTIGPNITAEPFDIKEGAYANIVEYSVIYGTGISGNNFADSHIDIKGYETIIRYNTFYQNENENIERAIMIVPRISAGVDAEYTAHDNYIHDNVFYLEDEDVEIAVANSGAEDNYAWDNVRDPADGNWYNSRITEEEPEGYDEESTNQSPTADAGSDISAEIGAEVVLDGSASSDPDGDDLTYAWTQTSGSDVTLENSETSQASFYADEEGEYEFSLVVSDGEKSGSDSVTVTISETLEIFEVTASAGENGSISPSGTVEVEEGSEQTFTIVADDGYEIADVTINGVSTGVVDSYTFTDISSDQSIAATFQEEEVTEESTYEEGTDDDSEDTDESVDVDDSDEYETISGSFEQDGSGSYKWKTTTISSNVNSWCLESLTINGEDYTNTWSSASSLPETIDGYYYIEYTGSYDWSHFELD